MIRLSALTLFFYRLSLVLANVEKTIFVAPPTVAIPQQHPNLDDLYLIPLSSGYHQTVRTHVNASFPTDDAPRGSESWFLLDGLTPNQRYEVRICWMATEPTNFWLTTYTLQEVFETPELISSLSTYAYVNRELLSPADLELLHSRRSPVTKDLSNPTSQEVHASVLFLQIQAAADYFTLNKTLMENVPPVFVDVILDPFLLNVFPESLLPTAGYLVPMAVIAWFISGFVWQYIKAIGQTRIPMQLDTNREKKDS